MIWLWCQGNKEINPSIKEENTRGHRVTRRCKHTRITEKGGMKEDAAVIRSCGNTLFTQIQDKMLLPRRDTLTCPGSSGSAFFSYWVLCYSLLRHNKPPINWNFFCLFSSSQMYVWQYFFKLTTSGLHLAFSQWWAGMKEKKLSLSNSEEHSRKKKIRLNICKNAKKIKCVVLQWCQGFCKTS